MSISLRLTLIALVQLAALLGLITNASAKNITVFDIIAAVNNLRASQGLSPYQIDSWLMSYAQQHSEYQASTNTGTHLHSDGFLPWQVGIQENIAGGDIQYMTADKIINQIWADPVHRKTMTGYPSGFIGVGMASNSSTTFITLDVRPGDNPATVAPRLTTGASSNPSDIPIFIEPLLTATPNPDGSVVHVVGYGQALWSIAIAYGVKINDIRRLNNLPFDSTNIYTGQKLIIRPPGTVSPSTTASHTPEVTQVAPPTETLPPSLAASPYASPSRTQAPGLPSTQTMSTNTIGMVLLVILALGLLAFVVWSAYRR